MRINDPKHLGSPRDVTRGLAIGALAGALYGARVAISASRPSGSSPGDPFLIAAVVFVGGCVAGGIIGAFRPLARRLPVALLLGFVTVFPVLIALDVIRSRVTIPPSDIRWGVDALSALIIGPFGVLAVRAASTLDRAA